MMDNGGVSTVHGPTKSRRPVSSCGKMTAQVSRIPTVTTNNTTLSIPSGALMPYPKSWIERTLPIMTIRTLMPSSNCTMSTKNIWGQSTMRQTRTAWMMRRAWTRSRRRRLAKYGTGSRSEGPTRRGPEEETNPHCLAKSAAA